MRGKKIVGWLSRISPEAVGRAASGRYAGCESAAGEVFGCIPHGARAYRERTSLPWGLTPLYCLAGGYVRPSGGVQVVLLRRGRRRERVREDRIQVHVRQRGRLVYNRVDPPAADTAPHGQGPGGAGGDRGCALHVRRDHRLVVVCRGTDKARARGIPPRAQVVSAGGLRRRPQAVRAPSPEGIPKMNDFFTMGSDPIVLYLLSLSLIL